MRHSLRAVSLWWLIVLVPIMAGAAAPNKAPIAKNDAATTAVDTSVTINVTANDRDRDGRIVRKTVKIVGAGPQHGRAGKPRNGKVTYTPNLGFSGQDTFRYHVRDNRGALSKRARVQVTVTVRPVADAGPDRNAVTGLPVILNGSASFDPDGNTLGYSWRFLSVPSASARTSADIVNPASPAPSFTPDVDGNYELELTVTDGTLSDTDGVVITAAAPGGVPPNADAGSDIVVQLVSPAQTVTLNGSASDDPDDFPNPTLMFQWTFVSTPPGSALTNGDIADPTTATASFIPDVLGVYLLRLDVFDGENTDFDQVTVTAQPPTPPPPPVITSITPDNTPTVSGTAATGIIKITLYQNDTPVPVPPAVSVMTNGAWSYTYTTVVLPIDTYTFTATGTNEADQESALSAPMTVKVANTGPSEPSINPDGSCNGRVPGLVPAVQDETEIANNGGQLRKCLFGSGGGTPARAVIQKADANTNTKTGPIRIYDVIRDHVTFPQSALLPDGIDEIVLRINITDGPDKLPSGAYHLKFFVSDVAGNESCTETFVIPAENTGCADDNTDTFLGVSE